MNLLVDETKLDLLLEKKRKHLGHASYLSHVNNATSSAMLLAGALTGSFPDARFLAGEQMKWLSVAVGIWGIFWSVCGMISACMNKYGVDELRKDIHDLNEVEHPYSIIAIKDSFNKYPNRYLLYYDRNWDCSFFPNYKTAEADNENNIRQRLSAELKLGVENITVEKRGFSIHTKYSVRSKQYKTYAHTLYQVVLDVFPKQLKADTFIIDGKQYCWRTICEMEADKQIQEKNLDVVAFVKNNIA